MKCIQRLFKRKKVDKPMNSALNKHNVIKSVCDLYSRMEDCDRFRFRKYEGCKHCRYKQTVL